MNQAITYRVGIDVAKGVFQAHAVKVNVPGEPVAFKKRLKRAQMEAFFANLPASAIGMEACGSAHYWARVARRHGHEVRLMPPAYVKAYVKRNKTDAIDAEAICEALSRPTMRFVPVKGEEDQARVALHRIRASFVEKRTAAANQLRAELSEFGIVAAKGERGLSDLLALVETEAERIAALPAELRLVLAELARQWRSCDEAVRRMDREIAMTVRNSPRAMRLTFVPGIGPIGASAIDAMLPNPHVFKSGRHFAAYLGLTPREDSSGKTVRRGGITKKGDTYLRRILVLGATAVLARVRRGQVQGVSPWVLRMAAHPKRKLAATALANKMARIAWAMLAKGEDYRAPTAALAAA
ncbi:MAG TPA: IS110 family transposase [Hyphomicrobiaceae bacterium]|nr:IS110 family transposase [Hyphomicrobiaceae bacterium]